MLNENSITLLVMSALMMMLGIALMLPEGIKNETLASLNKDFSITRLGIFTFVLGFIIYSFILLVTIFNLLY